MTLVEQQRPTQATSAFWRSITSGMLIELRLSQTAKQSFTRAGKLTKLG